MDTQAVTPAAADQDTVFAEQVRLVYELGRAGAVAVMLVAWVYASLMWSVAPRRELLLWTAVITLVSVVRIAMAVYRQRQAVDTHARAWGYGLAALAAATGLLWAYAATALFPHDHPDMQFIAVFILVGMPAGAVASFGPYVLSYACYVVSAVLPFGISLYLRGGDFAGWLLLASLVFMAFLVRVALWTERTLRDNITQRLALHGMAQGLTQARDAAESADRAKSSFLANMSHEVRTPLNAMIGMNELLLMSQLTEAQRDKLQVMQQASHALLDMLDAVLEMSRIEAGALELHEEPFDPHTLVRRIERLYRPVALRKQLTFNVEIAPDAPHALVGDPVRWHQVLGVLVDNALKFTEHGAVSVAVEARVDAAGVCLLRAEVSDTGIGISPEERYLLFKRFTQIDSGLTRRHGGAGAGLGIASELAKLMGGDVGVNSEKGKGSRFWFNARMRLAA